MSAIRSTQCAIHPMVTMGRCGAGGGDAAVEADSDVDGLVTFHVYKISCGSRSPGWLRSSAGASDLRRIRAAQARCAESADSPEMIGSGPVPGTSVPRTETPLVSIIVTAPMRPTTQAPTM